MKLVNKSLSFYQTHIVEDVRDLCSSMAIINSGTVIKNGKPSELLKDIQGNIWCKTIIKKDLDKYKKNLNVISVRLIEGKTQIHVYSNQCPDNGFSNIDADLEDLFFASLNEHLKGGKDA